MQGGVKYEVWHQIFKNPAFGLGKNIVTKEEFLRGYKLKLGDIINA